MKKAFTLLLIALLALTYACAAAEAPGPSMILCRSEAKTDEAGITSYVVHFKDNASSTSVPVLTYCQNAEGTYINKIMLYSMNNGKFFTESCVQDGNVKRNYILFSRSSDGLVIEKSLVLMIRGGTLALNNSITSASIYTESGLTTPAITEGGYVFLNDQLGSDGITISEEGTKVTGGSLLYNLENTAIDILTIAEGLTSNTRYVIATSSVKVRKGAGTKYKDVDRMHEGDRATYLNATQNDETGRAWYYVDYEGNMGWVTSEFAEFEATEEIRAAAVAESAYEGGTPAEQTDATGEEGTDEAEGEPAPQPAPVLDPNAAAEISKITGTVTVTDGKGVKMRSGPGKNYEKVAILEKGDTAAAVGDTAKDDEGRTWIHITRENLEGWVCADYVGVSAQATSGGETVSTEGYGMVSPAATVAPVGSTAVVQTPDEPQQSYVTAKQNVRIRAGAGTDYPELTILPTGGTVPYLGGEVTDDEGVEWCHVRYEGQDGWMMVQYVEITRIISQVG